MVKAALTVIKSKAILIDNSVEDSLVDFLNVNGSPHTSFFTSILTKSIKFCFYVLLIIIPVAFLKLLYPYEPKIDILIKLLLVIEVALVGLIFLGYFQLLFS